MKQYGWIVVPVVVILGAGIWWSLLERGSQRAAPTPQGQSGSNLSVPASSPEPVNKAAVNQKLASLHLPFIANQGQTDEQVKFYVPTFGGTLYVTQEGELVYALPADSVPSSKFQVHGQWPAASGQWPVPPPQFSIRTPPAPSVGGQSPLRNRVGE